MASEGGGGGCRSGARGWFGEGQGKVEGWRPRNAAGLRDGRAGTDIRAVVKRRKQLAETMLWRNLDAKKSKWWGGS